MENALKLLLLGVASLVTAVLVMAGVSLMSSGQSTMNQGSGMLDASLAAYSDVDKTQYEGASVSGAQVVELIKQYWKEGNTCAILVSTKDGANVLYDYSGYTALLVGSAADELTNWPTATAGTGGTAFGSSGSTNSIVGEFGAKVGTGGKLTAALSRSLYNGTSVNNKILSLCTRYDGQGTALAEAEKGSMGCETFDYAAGYKEPSGQKAGFINKQGGIFKGSCQYDVNQNIRCITFVQTR